MKVLRLEWKSEGVLDDESGESMEPMEEVPLKEPGETESGVSRGIPDDADCIFRISGGRVCCL